MKIIKSKKTKISDTEALILLDNLGGDMPDYGKETLISGRRTVPSTVIGRNQKYFYKYTIEIFK